MVLPKVMFVTLFIDSLFLSRYTYGKPVVGTAAVFLSISGRNYTDDVVVPFARHAFLVSF